jgi:hypothetical protein
MFAMARSVNKLLLQPAAKPLLFLLALLPFGLAAVWGAGQHAGRQPGRALIRSTGDWTLRFLCLTLASRRCANGPAGRRWRGCAACSACSPSSTACCTSCATPGWTWAWTSTRS